MYTWTDGIWSALNFLHAMRRGIVEVLSVSLVQRSRTAALDLLSTHTVGHVSRQVMFSVTLRVTVWVWIACYECRGDVVGLCWACSHDARLFRHFITVVSCERCGRHMNHTSPDFNGTVFTTDDHHTQLCISVLQYRLHFNWVFKEATVSFCHWTVGTTQNISATIGSIIFVIMPYQPVKNNKSPHICVFSDDDSSQAHWPGPHSAVAKWYSSWRSFCLHGASWSGTGLAVRTALKSFYVWWCTFKMTPNSLPSIWQLLLLLLL